MNTGSGFQSAVHEGTHAVVNIDTLRVGGAQMVDKRHFNGAIDDVRIYGHAMSQAELQSLYDGDEPTGASNSPVFTSDPISKANAKQGSAYTGQTLAGNATDADNDPLTFSLMAGPAWLKVASDGTLSGTPGANNVGPNVFMVKVSAADGSDTATLNITVDADGSGGGTGTGWTELLNDDFENGLVNWIDGGGDVDLSTSHCFGTYCLNIQDNSGVASSATLAKALDLTGYSQLRIAFTYMPISFEGSEDFWVQYSGDGGSSWITIKAFVHGVDFSNGIREYPVLTISDGKSYGSDSIDFTSNVKIRFRADASGNADDAFIDNVVISGFSSDGGTGNQPTYPSSQGDDTSYEWIASVNIGSIQRASGTDGGYYDATSTAMSAAKGRSVAVTLTPGFNANGPYHEFWRVWIDLNHDGDFTDAGEDVFEGRGQGPVTGSFTLPSSYSYTGSTRMRIAMRYFEPPPSDANFDFGEVEDYTVIINP
jgi:hypothetical protein